MQLDDESEPHVLRALHDALHWCDAICVHVLSTGACMPRAAATSAAAAAPPPPPPPHLQPAAWTLAALRAAALSFQPLQVGICPIHIVQKERSLAVQARPFNLVVFPQSYPEFKSAVLSSTAFDCEPLQISFLSKHNFDFNRCIMHGIPYMSFDDEAIVRQMHRAKQNASEAAANTPTKPRRIVPTEPRDIAFVEVVSALLEKFVATESASAAFEAVNSCKFMAQVLKDESLKFVVNAAKNNIVLTAANSFLRRILHQHIDVHPSLHCHREESAGRRRPGIRVSVCAGGKEEAERLKKEQQENEKRMIEDNIQRAIGARNILQKLVDAKKMVIGERVLESLIMFERVFSGDALPNSASLLKQTLHNRFDNVYDVVCMEESLDNSSKQGQIELQPGFERYSCHADRLEAGFLAYQSAKAFAGFIGHIADSSGSSIKTKLDEWLCPFANKVSLEPKRSIHLGHNDREAKNADHQDVLVVSITSPSPCQLDALVCQLNDNTEFSIAGRTAESVFLRMISKETRAAKESLQRILDGIGDADGRLRLSSHQEFVDSCNVARLEGMLKRQRQS